MSFATIKPYLLGIAIPALVAGARAGESLFSVGTAGYMICAGVLAVLLMLEPSVSTAKNLAAVKSAIVKVAGSMLAGLLLVGCLTSAEKSQLEQEAITAGENAAACVAGQALNGQTSAEAIAVSCGVSAGGPAVLQIISTLVGDLSSAASDAGAAAVGFAPGASRDAVIAALKSVH